jgi:hypothetical protein
LLLLEELLEELLELELLEPLELLFELELLEPLDELFELPLDELLLLELPELFELLLPELLDELLDELFELELPELLELLFDELLPLELLERLELELLEALVLPSRKPTAPAAPFRPRSIALKKPCTGVRAAPELLELFELVFELVFELLLDERLELVLLEELALRLPDELADAFELRFDDEFTDEFELLLEACTCLPSLSPDKVCACAPPAAVKPESVASAAMMMLSLAFIDYSLNNGINTLNRPFGVTWSQSGLSSPSSLQGHMNGCDVLSKRGGRRMYSRSD